MRTIQHFYTRLLEKGFTHDEANDRAPKLYDQYTTKEKILENAIVEFEKLMYFKSKED